MSGFKRPSDKDRIRAEWWDPDEWVQLLPVRSNEAFMRSLLESVHLPKGVKAETVFSQDLKGMLQYVDPVQSEHILIAQMIVKARRFYVDDPDDLHGLTDYEHREQVREELRATGLTDLEVEAAIDDRFGVPFDDAWVSNMDDDDRGFLRKEVEARDGSLRRKAEEGVPQPPKKRPGDPPRFQPGVSGGDDLPADPSSNGVGSSQVVGKARRHH